MRFISNPTRPTLSLHELLDGRVKHDLRRLETVGVLTSTPQGDFVVRAALRGAVARGVVTAMAILSGEFETD